MVKRTPSWVWVIAAVVVVVVSLPLIALAGFGGGESDDRDSDNTAKAAKAEKPVDGSFVGEVSGTKAFIAVVAEPAEGKQDRRAVQVYVSDGRRFSEWLSGSILANTFVARSDAGAEAKGKLSGNSVTGTLALPDGNTSHYVAGRPAGAAGLYDVTVSRAGKLRGVSAAGLAVKGQIGVQGPGTGFLKLADGERLKFDITRKLAGDLIRLRTGQVRLIVLPGGQLRGAGEGRPTAGGGEPDFFIRST
jgi:hypothetical protein